MSDLVERLLAEQVLKIDKYSKTTIREDIEWAKSEFWRLWSEAWQECYTDQQCEYCLKSRDRGEMMFTYIAAMERAFSDAGLVLTPIHFGAVADEKDEPS